MPPPPPPSGGVMPSTPSLPLSTAGVSIVTFHLPIWLKAVDIIKQANLNVIARLGGFHQLKSYLGLMGNIMQHSGLLEGIQLIYPGSTTANHKAICAYLLINAVIYQHIMKLAFTDHEEQCGDMRAFMEKVADRKIGARNTDPVVAVFEEMLKKPLSDLQKEEEHLHSGCRTTIWQMRSRSLSELSNLQTTMGICLALLQRCFTSLLLQAIINTPSTHGWNP